MSSQAQPLMVFPVKGLNLGELTQGGLETSEVQIRNPCQQAQIWHAKIGGVSWLTLSPKEGTLQPDEEQAIGVSIDSKNMVIGNQTAIVTFTSEVDNSSAKVQVPVTVNIQPTPEMDIGDMSTPTPRPGAGHRPLTPSPIRVDLNFDLRPNSSQTSTLAITNQFGKPAKWTSSIQTSPNAKGWLSLIPPDGTVPGRDKVILGVKVNTNGLKTGDYNATVSIFTEASNNRTKRATVGIALHVGIDFYGDDGPHCSVGPQNQVNFVSTMVESTLHVVSSLVNQGPVKFTVDNGGVSWLTANPTNGTLQPGGQRQVGLKVDASALQSRPQPYQTDVTFTYTYVNRPEHPPTLSVVPITVTV